MPTGRDNARAICICLARWPALEVRVKYLALLVAMCAAIGSSARSAQADPLVVTAPSFLSFGPEDDGFRFSGSGFSFATDPFGLFSIAAIAGGGCLGTSIAGSSTPCNGALVDQSVHTPGEVDLGRGTASVGGRTFADVSFRGDLTFTATPALFPGGDGGPVVMRAPFVFTGLLRGFSNGDELFVVDLTGRGFTERTFYLADQGYTYQLESRTGYDFDPQQNAVTPEPASMLLLGSGLAIVAARRRQRR